jgi:uncharacterized protein with NRDE domain
MCLLLLAYKTHPNNKLIIAANRDEFYERPALPLHKWESTPEIFAGKDIQGKGTWLGITKNGKIAAITNYRDMNKIKADAPTRGKLITDFLLRKTTAEKYSDILLETADTYNGYNLIYGDVDNLFYFSNINKEPIKLSSGIHGISNHLLDTPWPKVVKSKKEFTKIISEKNPSEDKLFQLLRDSEIFNKELPDTGLGKELERMVSPIFTVTEKYGTRSSSVIFVDLDNNVTFTEKSLVNENKKWKTSSFNFKIG